jgi:hypothetical protein
MIKRRAGAIFGGILMIWPTFAMAQTPAQTAAQTPEAPPVELMTANQLENLVAPVALYPDGLLGQILAASTYPLEVVEAQQWRLQNSALEGPQLLDAAKQQNWDPSVQALVAFPSVLTLLNRDIRWTTDLGNAMLAQQADVMDAVQRLRRRARDNGKLASTPEQTVTVAEDAQAPIAIQPANPQVIYVPSYNPAYVWGTPAYGAYPALGYPSPGFGFGFNPAVLLSTIFTGLLNFGPWGWGLNWLTHALFLNNLFFGHFGFGGGFGGGGFGVWAHNPGHRLGVAYPNRVVSARFAGRSGGGFTGGRSYSSRSYAGNSHAYAPAARMTASRASRYDSPLGGSRGSSAYAARGSQSFANRSSSSTQHYSAPKAASYRSTERSARSAERSAARASNPGRSAHVRAPKVSSHGGGHSSGHSGGHSGKHK